MPWAGQNVRACARLGPYVALAIHWLGRNPFTAPPRNDCKRANQTTTQQGPLRHAKTKSSRLYAVTAERGTTEAEHWATSIQTLAESEFQKAHLAIGIGRPVDHLLELRQSYHEAAQALALEERLRHHKPQVYANLGVYRLLLPLTKSSELRLFADQVLGRLIRYDRADKADLLETLRVYFQCNGNVAHTAKALYIHRNTLLYRLDRIRQLGGFDLDDAETRLYLQLALRAHELTWVEGE